MTTDYQTYKASREWAVRREAVRKRANGKCERCLTADMQQVHHLTYARIGEEPLEDLLGVCKPCHEFLSAKTDTDPVILNSLADGVRVYLAGPITGTSWRDELLVKPAIHDLDGLWPDRYEGFNKEEYWPVALRGLRDGFDFTGPWFEDVPVPEDPHGWVNRDQDRYRKHFDIDTRHYVASACRAAIEDSDIVFSWIPSGCSPWGTVWELGFATALDKIIVIYEHTGNNSDRWLAGTNAAIRGRAETPRLAWEYFLKEWRNTERNYSEYLRERMLENRKSRQHRPSRQWLNDSAW